MSIIRDNIKWIMLLVGLVTCSMVLAAISPRLGLTSMFGAYPSSIDHAVIQIVVRNWGLLIALVGGMLVYAAFYPALRRFTIVIACISKASFISLVLTFGWEYLDKAIVAVVFDALVIMVFALYLITTDARSINSNQ